MIDTKYYSLLKVMETGSYTKAAKALSLSQPAVSQHIRLLEKELCIRIFERTRNQSRLTKEGKIVVKYVRRMVALQDLLERDLKNEKEKITSLTIGITHTAESNVIVEALAAYVSMNDGMNLKIVTDSTDQLYRMLKNYELDFALIEDRISDPSLNHILLDTDCLVLAVSPQHKLASRSTITINDLKKEKLILRLPNSRIRPPAEDGFSCTTKTTPKAVSTFTSAGSLRIISGPHSSLFAVNSRMTTNGTTIVWT